MKYCPLCGDEYKEGVHSCAQCGASLVASLDADKERANRGRLLWSGRDFAEFDLVAATLREAQIPARKQRALGGLVGSIIRRASTIHVLLTDLARALESVLASLAGRPTQSGREQICYNCSTACSAYLAICPSCKAELIVEPVAAGSSSSAAVTDPLKYCPLCSAEYTRTHERCTVCGVDLVAGESLGTPQTEAERNDRLELVWRGGDPAALSLAVATLRDAGIRHHVQSSSDHLIFELAMPRPKYNLRVLQGDAERARRVLADVQESPFFGAQMSPDFPEGSAPSVEAPSSPWNPAAANAEIWSGEDAAFARLLEACLSENRIRVRRQGVEPGVQRLLVLTTNESRAREILREIVEGTPPE
jgi:hypothetical protein